MKTLYMIGGTMGVGKTTVCQQLKQDLQNSVFIDGDWCWDASPFQVTDETKAMVIDNICHLLNNFLKCSVTYYQFNYWKVRYKELYCALYLSHRKRKMPTGQIVQWYWKRHSDSGHSRKTVILCPGNSNILLQKQVLFRYLFYIIPITCYYSVNSIFC